MDALFGSHVLEVGAGLIFTFLAISLISGAIVEAIGSCTKLRAQTLLSGVQSLLNDHNFNALASELYAHAAINPRGPGADAPKTNIPTYIDKHQFAAAIMDITGMSNAIRMDAAARAAAGGPGAGPAGSVAAAAVGQPLLGAARSQAGHTQKTPTWRGPPPDPDHIATHVIAMTARD